LDKIPYDELRDKFRAGMDEMTKKVFKEAVSKKVAGRPINGGGMCVFVNFVLCLIVSLLCFGMNERIQRSSFKKWREGIV
jgi:hypothetical protein